MSGQRQRTAGYTKAPEHRHSHRRLAVAEQRPPRIGVILKRRCRLAELDPAIFGSHSLRSGFLTSGAMSGSSVFKLLEVSRHRSIDTLRAYVKRQDLFQDHAGAAFL